MNQMRYNEQAQTRLTEGLVEKVKQCTRTAHRHKSVSEVFRRGLVTSKSKQLEVYQTPKANMWGDKQFNFPIQGTYDLSSPKSQYGYRDNGVKFSTT